MRANGIDEKYITGDASDKEKFMAWAKTVPYTMRNPLFHWTHLELQRYFNINELLNPSSANEIYDKTNELLNSTKLNCRGLLAHCNVETLCTTDDPTDHLEHHKQIAKQGKSLSVFPTFRPDRALSFNDTGYLDYLKRLSESSSIKIESLTDYLEAIEKRIEYFHENGCRIADLGFNKLPMMRDSVKNHDVIFKKILNAQKLDFNELEDLQAYALNEICKMYYDKGWVQQFHLGALRNNNQRAYQQIGPDTGYDSIGDDSQALSLSRFLDHLESEGKLTKTIVYNLNPRDNDLFASMMGNFNDGKIIGKMQFGSGWWFLDQKQGIENQLNSVSNMGLLSRFVGMLTDSRSFLSFPRHEYFRRILCNMIGKDVENVELPNDIEFLGQMVQDISYNNAKRYFNFRSI